MIRIIILKELKEIARTSRMSWMLVSILVLLALSLYNGYSYQTKKDKLLSTSQKITYQQFISQGDKNPHLGAHFGFYAYKPTADLGMIDNGLEPYTGNAFYLEPHKRGIIVNKEVSDATGLMSFGFLNVTFFIQFLFPVFIFLVSYNIFSKEWENGTIKLLLNSKATKQQLFTGKLLACLLLVYSILIILAVALCCLFLFSNSTVQKGIFISGFAVYWLGALVFSTLITILSVTVSLLVRHSPLALILLAGFWLLGVFLIPRVSGEISKHIYPSTTALEFENQTFNDKQYGVGDQGHKDVRREKLQDSVLQAYNVKRLEDLPVYFIPITIEYFEESDGQVMDKAYIEVEQNEAKQDRVVSLGSVLSPFLSFRDFSMKICGADMNIHRNFSEEAEVHRRQVGKIVDDFYEKNTIATNDFWKTVPAFSYHFPGITWRIRNATVSIVILLGWLCFSFLFMIYSYKKLRL